MKCYGKVSIEAVTMFEDGPSELCDYPSYVLEDNSLRTLDMLKKEHAESKSTLSFEDFKKENYKEFEIPNSYSLAEDKNLYILSYECAEAFTYPWNVDGSNPRKLALLTNVGDSEYNMRTALGSRLVRDMKVNRWKNEVIKMEVPEQLKKEYEQEHAENIKLVEKMLQKLKETKTVVTHFGDDLDNKSAIYALEKFARQKRYFNRK